MGIRGRNQVHDERAGYRRNHQADNLPDVQVGHESQLQGKRRTDSRRTPHRSRETSKGKGERVEKSRNYTSFNLLTVSKYFQTVLHCNTTA